ncbi:MAG: PaaI family thioesterase [Pseudomonadota bacterium]
MSSEPRFEPRDPNYAERVRTSFAQQDFMALLGVDLAHLAPGEVDLAVTPRQDLSQQHGFIHAGVTVSIADSAAGYAALSLFPADRGVLTTELKINLLNPARGDRLIARGRVVKPGRTLTICRAEVVGVEGANETPVATALLTMMAVEGLTD